MCEFSYLKTWTCIWSSARREWYHCPLPLLELAGAGIYCWGKSAPAGTERIDWNSIQPVLWSGYFLAVFSVCHLIFLTYFFLDPLEMKDQNTKVSHSSCDVLGTERRGWVSPRAAAECQGPLWFWGTLKVLQTPQFPFWGRWGYGRQEQGGVWVSFFSSQYTDGPRWRWNMLSLAPSNWGTALLYVWEIIRKWI